MHLIDINERLKKAEHFVASTDDFTIEAMATLYSGVTRILRRLNADLRRGKYLSFIISASVYAFAISALIGMLFITYRHAGTSLMNFIDILNMKHVIIRNVKMTPAMMSGNMNENLIGAAAIIAMCIRQLLSKAMATIIINTRCIKGHAISADRCGRSREIRNTTLNVLTGNVISAKSGERW